MHTQREDIISIISTAIPTCNEISVVTANKTRRCLDTHVGDTRFLL